MFKSFDEISEAEAPLERARRNAAVHIFDLVLFLIHPTTYYKRVLVNCNIDLFGLEACDGQRNAIGVLAGPNDIAGRIIVLGFEAEAFVHHVEKPIEADGGPPERIKIESPHSHILR